MDTTLSPGHLKHLSLFAGLTEQDKQDLLSGGRIRHCPRGQMLYAHGDPVSHFYIIVSGTFQLFRTNADGHQKTIAVLNGNRTMGEGEIMDSCHSHRVNAVPVEESVVLEFPGAWLKDAARKNSTFALNLLSLISAQAHMAEVEAEQQATMSAAQLVACFLQRLCVLYDFNHASFELPYSKTLIASRLGMELETFSRTLAKLKEHGITVQGTHVAIHDLKRIEHYVCSICSIADECATHQAMEEKTVCATSAKNRA
jgi:CRP-like cAMP-binding protein